MSIWHCRPPSAVREARTRRFSRFVDPVLNGFGIGREGQYQHQQDSQPRRGEIAASEHPGAPQEVLRRHDATWCAGRLYNDHASARGVRQPLHFAVCRPAGKQPGADQSPAARSDESIDGHAIRPGVGHHDIDAGQRLHRIEIHRQARSRGGWQPTQGHLARWFHAAERTELRRLECREFKAGGLGHIARTEDEIVRHDEHTRVAVRSGAGDGQRAAQIGGHIAARPYWTGAARR